MALLLSELFPDEDYRFHLTLRKGNLGEFFGAPDSATLAERERWLNADTPRYVAATERAGPLLAEFETLAANWLPCFRIRPAEEGAMVQRLLTLGQKLEPDFMLLARDEAGVFRLQAGVVCFPSSWALAEKIGLSLDDIHGVVPGLNPGLGAALGQFLDRLKPGLPFERANWGLAATPELNMHPHLLRPRLGLPFDPRQIWVRIEDQLLAALPMTGGILFGIRLRIVPLVELLNDRQMKTGFHRAIVSMSDALIAYKGMDRIRSQLLTVSS